VILYLHKKEYIRGPRGRDDILFGLQLPMQSVYITTRVVSSNPTHGEVYSIQHFVIIVRQLLPTGRWFSLGRPISSTINHQDITENC
jgi:hypothetical protein